MTDLRLKELRTKNKLTQADISMHLNIARETYTRYESGEREMTYEALIRLADLFAVSIDYLLGRYESNPVILGDVELSVIEDFRVLDERGKRSVQAIIEHERSQIAEDIKKSAI